MNYPIKNVHIENFKSLKNLRLEDCSKVNILLGKPNVGKTSVLEALSLLGSTFILESRFFAENIHYENLSNLFYDQELGKPVVVRADGLGAASIRYVDAEDFFAFSTFHDESELQNFHQATLVKNLLHPSYNILRPLGDYHYKQQVSDFAVRKYAYQRRLKYDNPALNYLLPPFGENLVAILQTNKELRQVITPFFEQYGLELALDGASRTLSIQKRKDGLAYILPYSMVADTLQRMILYIAALYSNHNAVLLFEEPEAHAFPPYTKMLADYIALDETNQLFIATHSPYLLDALLTQSQVEVSVYVMGYLNHQAVAHRLSESQIERVFSLGAMVFANIDRLMQSL